MDAPQIVDADDMWSNSSKFALNCIEAGFAFLLLCSLSIENQSSRCLFLCFQTLRQDIAERHVIIY